MVLLTATLVAPGAAAAAARVREYTQVFTTYPFSDPNPVPVPGRIYPYFRFDGYTDVPVERAWTVVELENDYVRVLVLPEIGGKIWTAIDKTTGRPFIYYNHVVKFRDIAMRGPWTSGGIEPNYGIIGHTPNCATPVDYLAETRPDGSARVTIGVLDLLTRTPWRLEIALPSDAAYFTTRSLWQNTSALEQPYYTWMNAGLKAAGNLEFVYPGTHYLGHGGEVAPWPMHPTNGRNLAFYEQNDFGPYKSYHVFGKATDFFGAYWHDDGYGMARYSTRDDKAGKKIWIWGLSQQGMIWEKLLTDTDGQYVEVQSGRLFNQAAAESSRTPFKNRGFVPGTTDTWTEYWLPVKGTGGFVKANDLGALNVTREPGRLTLAFSPVQAASGRIEVFDGATLAASWDVRFTPLVPWRASVPSDIPDTRLRVRVLGARFEYVADPGADVIARPTVTPAGFGESSILGLHTSARELIRQRAYSDASRVIDACLQRDPLYAPALVDAAMLHLRRGDARAAFAHAQTALSIDTYDPAANYYYGRAAEALGRLADARDGFALAAQSAEWRGAAWFALGQAALREGRVEIAQHYAGTLTAHASLDVQGWQLLVVAHRLAGEADAAARGIARLLEIDPLNHVARFERALASGRDTEQTSFAHGVRGEMPHETFLEMAAWYVGLGREHEARTLLALAPSVPEVQYWRAWLSRTSEPTAAARHLADANAASPALTFPFRAESVPVFTWAVGQGDAWQPRYYLALIELGRGNDAVARALLRDVGNAPGYAPFYALRAGLPGEDPAMAATDLQRAMQLDPAQWRLAKQFVDLRISEARYADAVTLARAAYAKAPSNYIVGMQLARSLLLDEQPAAALEVLDRLKVLPYEGSVDGRRLSREAHLRLAMLAPDTRAARRHVADAQLWPEHLGAGKPYDADIDRRLDDYVAWRLGEIVAPGSDVAARDRVLVAGHGPAGVGGLVAALALRDAGRTDDARRAFDAWAGTEARAPFIAWGRALMAREAVALPALRHQMGDYGVLAAVWPD